MSFLKNIWRSSSKHKKLYEEWALTNIINKDSIDDSSDSVTFNVKYMGSTLVDAASDESITAEAIKTILRVAKAGGRKLPRVQLTVCLRGITVSDPTTGEDQMDISIYRISYCSADASHDRVFAFIAANSNETMECHAFLCPKRRVTQAVTLTVAQAFNTAYEAWRKHEQKRVMLGGECSKEPLPLLPPSTPCTFMASAASKQKAAEAAAAAQQHRHQDKGVLIDFNTEYSEKERLNQPWVCFDDNEEYNSDSNSPQTNRPWEEKQPINLLCS